MTTAYVESSALTKLVVREPESAVLADALARHDRRVCSALGAIEVTRVAARTDGTRGLARARSLLLMMDSVPIDDFVVDHAARLEPWSLRSLDAIHVATALLLARDDVVFFSYDRLTVEAAAALGLVVSSPA